MRYDKRESKQYAHQHLRGIWAAVPTTFKENLDLDLEAFGHNVEHWVEKLQIDGLFVGGKQGEFFSMSIEERSEEHTSELQSQSNLVCRLLLEKKKKLIQQNSSWRSSLR